MKPLPAGLVCASVMAAAVTLQSPLCLGAALAGGVALLLAAPPPRRLYVVVAATTAVTVFAINPFVSTQGVTVLWQGPHVWDGLIDTQITLEELAYGAGSAARIAATVLAAAAFIRLVDADLLLRAVSRVAPRSAMIAALATQMLPGLERDAHGLAMAARTRGASLRSTRTAATLLPALLTMSLERSLATAESMEARGYGAPGRTRAPERPMTATEWSAAALGAAGLAVTCAALATAAGGFRYYQTLGDPFTWPAAATATGLALSGVAAGVVIRWRR